MSENFKVLYVDDEIDLLEIAESLFLEEGLPVQTSNSAITALELFTKDHFPIIISDARMPDMSGLELLLRLRRDHQFSGHFILVTGDDDLFDKSSTLDCDLILQKPICYDELVSQVRKMLLNPKK